MITHDFDQIEKEDYLKHNHRKIMRKTDYTYLDDDTIANGAIVNPIITLSSSHMFIKRNLLPISDLEYIYISGSNLILHNESDDSQLIITIFKNSLVTSLFYQISARGDRLVVVGEKILPINTDHENCTSQELILGRVEIINIDKLEERIMLDHTYYVNYDSFVYDAKVIKETDYCISILKNSDLAESETKVFMWDYFNKSLLVIKEFEHHIDNICTNKKGNTEFLFYSSYYCALWEYFNPSKKLILKNVYSKDTRQITDAAFVNTGYYDGVLISFSSHKIELFNDKYELFRSFNLNDMFLTDGNLSISKYKENSEIKHINHLLINENLDINLILKTYKLDQKNAIKYIISRDQYVFIFFVDSKIYIILEFEKNKNDKIDIKLNSIEKLNNNIISNSSVFINTKITKMTILCGEQTKSMFMNKFDETRGETRKNMFIYLKEKKGVKLSTTEIAKISKKKDIEIVRHQFERVKMRYYNYEISIISSTPILNFKREIYPFSGSGQSVNFICVSSNPRIILAMYSKKQLNIYQQYNIDEVNSIKNENSSQYLNFESNFLNHHQYLKKHTKVSLINTQFFDNHPNSITINLQGNNFFITFEEVSYLYTIIDKEVKEMAKINSYCRIAEYSLSGQLLAFANSEYKKTEYNIVIINTNTFDVEYMITKLPMPLKIKWADNDTKLFVLFQDTTTNILGWALNDNRLIQYNTKDNNKNEKFNSDEDVNKDTNLILKITDYAEKIVDFAYDDVFDFLVLCSEEKVVKVFQPNLDDVHWEFPIDCKYTCVVLIKKLDIVIFGTSQGSIRIYLWPITNFTAKEIISPPSFYEKCLHIYRVNNLVASSDLQFLYSTSIDGSIYISSLQAVNNEDRVTMARFNYFDHRNILPKKIHMNYCDFTLLTDGVYKSKIENIEKRQMDVESIRSEFVSEMEKLMGENVKDMEKKRTEMNEKIEKKRKIVKRLEDDKETSTKQFKEKRENQVKIFQDEIKKLKNKYKIDKDNLQSQTKNLTQMIKNENSNFSNVLKKIEVERSQNNSKINDTLENMLNLLKDKNFQIEKLITSREKIFESETENIQKDNENNLKEKDRNLKNEINENLTEKNKLQQDISKKKKDNLNYDQKINEWESNLTELKNNNADLIECHLFNTLKLKQMNNLLKENEKKISENELEVKKQRTTNDRLDKLRYVLEYQIKNLIKEKTPVEEQIKNFEELHNDFYKRFNLLYAEQLNIDEFINNNKTLIKYFKGELSKNKQVLFNLKNIFKSIELQINFILKHKLDEKSSIINKLIDIYNTQLKDFVIDENSEKSDKTSNNHLQAKIIEKEINKQKNKILRDLIDKREYRMGVRQEKEYLMKDIRENNQQLIEECGTIRMNLEDILKYITDIEKKFIELTNSHLFLQKNENTKMIRQDIRQAKNTIMLADTDKTKIAKGNARVDTLTRFYDNNSPKSGIILENEMNSQITNKINIFKKIEENTDEMNTQNIQIEKMQNKIRELMEVEFGLKYKSQVSNLNSLNTDSVFSKNKNLITQPKTSNMINLFSKV